MPSIPQSLLWISLVVLWLFVLVPMLINKRDTVRRTSDVALSTRVLNGGVRSRLRRRSGPAAGHRHDPLWAGDGADLDGDYDDCEVEDYEEAVREAVQEARVRSHTRTVMVVASVTESTAEPITEPVYLDVDVVDENSGALPVGGGVQQSLFDTPAERIQLDASAEAMGPEPVAETPAEPESEPAPEPSAEAIVEEPAAEEPAAEEAAADLGDEYEYEYVDDTSGLEVEDEPEAVVAEHPGRRRRLASTATAEAVTARKYRFRKRTLTVMAAVMVLTAALSLSLTADLWWACGAAAAVTVLYLAYLRRQTRIEEQVRRRRQQRMARTRRGEEAGESVDDRPVDRNVDDVPSRLRRPGAVVLDIDDEDPIFEHLDEVRYSRRYDLPRAAGQ